jgi:hypothetical protein
MTTCLKSNVAGARTGSPRKAKKWHKLTSFNGSVIDTVTFHNAQSAVQRMNMA